MKFITSRDNALYKELKHFATSSQARNKAGRTLLDGVHLCQAYLLHHGMPLFCIVSEAFLHAPEVATIVAQCEAEGAQCIGLPATLYQPLSQVENGIGLTFVIQMPTNDIPSVLDHAAVLLDNLQDPGNLGSILRSAAAAGIKHVYCSQATVSAWSPKVLRAGMGGHFLLSIAENVDLAELLRSATVPVLATSSHVATRIYDIDLHQPVAWLFGHEGQGVAENLLNLATHRVTIPHLGAIESLNVAASAAVCFFEQVRQKQQ